MAPGDVEIVQDLWEAFDRHGFGGVEQWVGLLSEDVELRSAIAGGAEGSVYRGHAGVRAWAHQVQEALNDLRLQADEYREVGERVVAIGHVSARGGASGLALDVPIAWVLAVRDGRVASLYGYLDVEEALADARATAAPRPGD